VFELKQGIFCVTSPVVMKQMGYFEHERDG